MIPTSSPINKLSQATYTGVFDALFTLGFGTTLLQTWGFCRVGQMVTLFPTSLVLAPSTSAFYSTGQAQIPPELCPLRTAMFPVAAVDNSVNVNGMILFNPNGAIALGALAAQALINNWTAANNKGFPISASVTPYFTYTGVTI